MLFRPLYSVFISALLLCAQAHAQLLLEEDFEDGNADGWSGDPGRGTLQLTAYGGNVSMRLARDASAVRAVDLAGAARVELSASFAAMDLEGGDACLLEFSADGASWTEIGRIADGRDDGVTLQRVSGGVELPADSVKGYIGVRIKANAANDVCWVDNIRAVAAPSRVNLEKTITPETFETGAAPSKPYAASAFAPPEEGAAPMENFQGVLRFSGEMADHFVLRRDDFNYEPDGKSLRALPPLEIGLVAHGGELIPLIRGPIRGDHPDWEWIVEPGRIWRGADGGVAASFPFALQERNANCIHNGLAAFRIGADGAMSHLVYQIGSETCAYMQFDLWGAGEASFEMRSQDGAEEALQAHEQEKAARFETRPIEKLTGLGDGAFGSSLEVNPEAMTLFGYVADGVHYTGGCDTRYGPYPYCDVMDIPSYSWAKSIVAAIAAMRLEKLYPGSMASLIRDYVPACDEERWDGATFENALDMTTGVYNANVYEADENSPVMRRFFLVEGHDEKIEIACTAFARKAEPGETFVYRTADTYILGAAMNAFLREQTGRADADFYDDLLVPIWRRIGLSPLVMTTRRTRDAAAQPFAGWGLTLHRNDIALIAQFLQQGGVIDGEAVLDEAMLAAALQKQPDDRGLEAVMPAQRYNNGLWAWNAGPAIGCKNDQWIPALSGYGGLSAALMPNGAVYYYVSDGGDYAWRRAAMASNALDSFCEAER
ncbi:hypothetical protein [Hyphococcus sp.]|jgi:hypothetical protein|uniref:hypothetical protein n=1 Tax=Hyphococcus sp. TaxID=2038636 RepID=UPI003D0D12E2